MPPPQGRAPLSILGMGWQLADTELSGDFLHREAGLARDPSWAETRLGIRRRFSVLTRAYIAETANRDPRAAIGLARERGLTPVTLGAQAARKALAAAGVRPSEVGWVVANDDTPFETIPSAAALIARELGVGPGPHCDLNAACSSFARHMQALADMEPSRLPEYTLCVQTGAYTTRTSYAADCIDGYIWSDGAAAQVVSSRRPGRLAVEPLVFSSDVSGAEAIVIDAAGHFRQDGRAVRAFAVSRTAEMFAEMARAKGLGPGDVYTVCHQNNASLQAEIVARLGWPAERHLSNVGEQGNIAAAGCPSVIAQSLERLRSGDRVLYAVLGAGLAWGGGILTVR